jgi:hypothetical protein
MGPHCEKRVKLDPLQWIRQHITIFTSYIVNKLSVMVFIKFVKNFDFALKISVFSRWTILFFKNRNHPAICQLLVSTPPSLPEHPSFISSSQFKVFFPPHLFSSLSLSISSSFFFFIYLLSLALL